MEKLRGNKGILIISLDFELLWGNIESWNPSEGYGISNVRNVRDVFNKLLPLFDKYDIKATIATVGLIMNDYKYRDDALPKILPTYQNKSMCVTNDFVRNISNENSGMYFGLDIVDQLKRHPNIEIGTHTYSHYYCWEKGQTLDQFEEDIKKAVEVAHINNLVLKSIVFPRNEVAEDYLEICAKYGITSYRGNPRVGFEKSTSSIVNLKNRVLRFLDTYINICGNTCYSLPEKNRVGDKYIQNIPASRFLRPYFSAFSFLDSLRLKRIEKEIKFSAKKGEVYHLWWHPHNFGADTEKNLDFLEKIFKVYADCHKKFGMVSLTMSDLSTLELTE